MNYSPLLLSTRMIYRHHNSGTYMAISLLYFTAFFQGEDNSIERDENNYKSGHVESFSYADGEMPIMSVLCAPVAGSVKSHRPTRNHCVFFTAFN